MGYLGRGVGEGGCSYGISKNKLNLWVLFWVFRVGIVNTTGFGGLGGGRSLSIFSCECGFAGSM